MSIKTDHSFHIGEQHLRNGKPCQDYAHSGLVNDELAYAIVSDGCSSGGMTDIGARLMTLATKRAIESYQTIDEFTAEGDYVSAVNSKRDRLLQEYAQTLQLENTDLLATSMWAIASPNAVFTHTTGDGVVAFVYEDDTWIQFGEWDKNMPYYPAYKFSGLEDAYRASHADNAEPFTFVEHGTAPVGQGGTADGFLSHRSIDEGICGISSHVLNDSHSVDVSSTWPGKLLAVGLFSDGVGQVDQINQAHAVEKLMAFKSTKGQFAVRRMNRFLKETKESGRGPIDDIAMAVIHLGNSATQT